MMGRPVTKIELSADEETTLQALIRRRKTGQGIAKRAQIVLLCAQGNSNKALAAKLGVSQQMVCKWRRRFVERRLDGLHDEPRPGGPREISDAEVEAVVVRTLESKPRNATHGPSREMARVSGISTSSMQRIWRAITDYIDQPNEDPKPFKWVRTADQILGAVKRFCERLEGTVIKQTQDSGH